MKARIIRSSKREFDCRIEETKEVVSAKALGNLLKGQNQLVAGDYVTLELQENEYMITHLAKRKNEVFRIIRRENKKKITASNIDVLIIVSAVSAPEYKQGLVDRYLLRSEQWGIPAFVIFNKMDEFNEQINLQFESERLRALNVRCFETSAKTEHRPLLLEGIEELKNSIQSKTALFLGQSGVGKSKLISALSDGSIELVSNALAKVGKGTHTTSWAEIIDLENFELVDSPGVRSFSIDDFHPDDLQACFPDLQIYFSQCKFSNCNHQSNSKGCAFENLDENEQETKIVLSRLESYLRFKEEIESRPEWDKNY